MDSSENYGIIIRQLRKRAGKSIQKASALIGKSAGWLCEVENAAGTCRLTSQEFDRIVDILGGSKDRAMFKTWVAGLKNQDRSSKQFDGAVLKYIRKKKGLSLVDAVRATGLSKGYLSKLENGIVPVTLERRNDLMRAYGYSPSSFKNLSTDPVRSKAVPSRFKFQIMIQKLNPQQAEEFFESCLAKMIEQEL